MATTNKSLLLPADGSLDWNLPLNDNFGYIDAALGATTTKSVTGVGTGAVVLTASEYRSLILNFTGTLTANVTYQIPSGIGGEWIVVNGTTGAFTLTIGNVAGGATVLVATASRTLLYSDGTNVYSVGGGSGGGATGGGTDQIFYENGQNVTTSYTVSTGKNAMSAGPITINSGVTVTVPPGAAWSIV